MEAKKIVGENSPSARHNDVRLLIVDDDRNFLETQADYLSMYGMSIRTAADSQEAIRLLEEHRYDVILTDMIMPGMDGIDLLKFIKGKNSSAEVIIFTGHGTVDTAVEAIKSGAFSYLQKPLSTDRVAVEIEKAAQHGMLKQENLLYRYKDEQEGGFFLDFHSEKMQKMMEELRAAAASDSNILLLGESGVGKEVAANFIHTHSARHGRAFIKVHCAALSSGLLESELFGHEKGAFTGAAGSREGRFELADGGTIFLDEISTVPMESQIKLLRVLQEKKIERVGGNKTINVDFRLVSASNDNLEKLLEDGRFRRDLYYRIGVIPINIPSLREMVDDIIPLTRFLVKKVARNCGKPAPDLAPGVEKAFQRYPWPGNIRELQNVIERSVVLNRTDTITLEDLPSEISGQDGDGPVDFMHARSLKDAVSTFEKSFIKMSLQQNHSNVTKTADHLDISRRNLQQKISRYGLKGDKLS